NYVIVVGAVGDRRFGGVHLGAAKDFWRYVFVRDGFDHFRPGDEHVGGVTHHEYEVSHCRRVDVAAGARSHDHRGLRHDARRDDISFEHFAVSRERTYTFLDPNPARIEQPNTRCTVLHRHVRYRADLLGVPLGGGAAEHGEVLGEDIGHAAIDRAPTGDDAVPRETVLVGVEIGVAVFDEHVKFFERIGVEKQLDALSRGQLAAGVLRCNSRFTPAQSGSAAAFVESLKDLFHGANLRSET